ncbi:MAG: hypothetical protein IAX22_03125 [Candidatus Bathyarchaeota archaeon]|nr:hypothetical protein [Candidatus Bathyarchaeota archaeon]
MKLWNKKEQIKEKDPKSAEQKAMRDFVRELIKKGIVEINPYLDIGGIRYPEAEGYSKDSSYKGMVKTINSLVDEKILKEKQATHVITCPKCTSPVVFSKFNCPRCGSEAVEHTKLLEHKTCGYIGSLKDFKKTEELTCPQCGSKLVTEGKDYRSIGSFYQCESCSNRFDKPEVVHECQNCGKVSTYQEVKYDKVSAYRVSDEILSELTSEFPLLENMGLFLENNGFKVKLHDVITGTSGTNSHFDLIAEKEKIKIVIDVSIEGKKEDIIAFLAKKMDVNPTKALLLDLSGSTELAALGKIYDIDVYGINITDSKAEQGVPRQFVELVTNLTKEPKKQ